MTTSILDAPGEIEPQWRKLAVDAGNAFVTPEWFRASRAAAGEDTEAAILTLTGSSGELRGLLPLVAGAGRRRRTFRFAGAAFGDRFHPLGLSPGDRGRVAGAGAALIAGHRDAIVLDNVEPAPWIDELAAGLPASRRGPRYRRASLPFARLEESWDGFLTQRSRNFRSQLSRKARVLAERHSVGYRLTETLAELDRDLDTFFSLHDARWSGRGGSAAASRAWRDFHRRFAHQALEQGWLRLWSLELDGRPAASWYGWRLGRRYSYYQAGFDPASAGLSIGFLLLAHTFRSAIEEGAREYDLLMGDEDYKRRFADDACSVETRVFGQRAHPTRLLAATEAGLRRAGEFLPDAARARGRGAWARLSRRPQ